MAGSVQLEESGDIPRILGFYSWEGQCAQRKIILPIRKLPNSHPATYHKGNHNFKVSDPLITKCSHLHVLVTLPTSTDVSFCEHFKSSHSVLEFSLPRPPVTAVGWWVSSLVKILLVPVQVRADSLQIKCSRVELKSFDTWPIGFGPRACYVGRTWSVKSLGFNGWRDAWRDGWMERWMDE